MEAEDLLRHRVRGIVAAAESRAEHLVSCAERDSLALRREAALELLATIADLERELATALRRLSATAARLGDPRDPAPAEARGQVPPRQPRTFARASMRDRPVAALFGVSARASEMRKP
jgi:hypothetical protein